MNQHTAKQQFFQGAVFLFLDVPEGTSFGIDLKSWNVGEKFRGIKMIPPGIHYVFYNAVDDENAVEFRNGFFHWFRKGEVLVRKWNKRLEDISEDIVAEMEIVHFKENITLFDDFLGPYPFEIWEQWKSLTAHIDGNKLHILSNIFMTHIL